MNYMGHEYVDLGLSVVWATCNLGAEKPEDCGDNYYWGETEPIVQEVSSLSEVTSAVYRSYDYNGMVKNETLRPEYDAARVQWGGYWRMPTRNEFDELSNHCTWKWTTVNGVKGYIIKSKVRGHKRDSIFLPMTDELVNDSYGAYWTSSSYKPGSAMDMHFYEDNYVSCFPVSTLNEMPIRPVIPLKAVLKEYPFAKVSHINPRKSVFSRGYMWDTALSRGDVPCSSAPEALRSHTAVGHFGEIITMKKK